MPHGDITFDPSHGDVLPCPATNCEQIKLTKRNFQYIASPECLPLQNLTVAATDGGITALNTFQ